MERDYENLSWQKPLSSTTLGGSEQFVLLDSLGALLHGDAFADPKGPTRPAPVAARPAPVGFVVPCALPLYLLS